MSISVTIPNVEQAGALDPELPSPTSSASAARPMTGNTPSESHPASTTLAVPSLEPRSRAPSLSRPLESLNINESEVGLAHSSTSPPSNPPSAGGTHNAVPPLNDSDAVNDSNTDTDSMDVDAMRPSAEKEAATNHEPDVPQPEMGLATFS